MRRMRPLRMLIGFILSLVAVLVILTALIYFFQDRVVFIPTDEIVLTPNEVNLPFEEVFIEVDSGQRIHTWYFPVEGAASTVLFFHGNAGNISHRVYTAQFLTSLGVNLLLVDYRGYGRSDGRASEAHVYADAKAAYDWLTKEKQATPGSIILFGRSLGGAVAVELATRVECGGLVVESSFTSANEMGKIMLPWMPTWMMTRFSFDSEHRITQVHCPVLVTHSPDDDLIPYEMGRRLFAAAPSPKEFIQLSGGHNDRVYYDSDIYVNGLQKFFIGGAEINPETER